MIQYLKSMALEIKVNFKRFSVPQIVVLYDVVVEGGVSMSRAEKKEERARSSSVSK